MSPRTCVGVRNPRALSARAGSFLLLAALVLPAAPTEASNQTRQSHGRYTQVAGDIDAIRCDTNDQSLGGLGGVCFTLQGDETHVTSLRITDDTRLEVGGFYQFTNGAGPDRGDVLSSGGFCVDAANMLVPKGAATLVVYVDGPVTGPLECLGRAAGIGVRGSVDVVWELKKP